MKYRLAELVRGARGALQVKVLMELHLDPIFMPLSLGISERSGLTNNLIMMTGCQSGIHGVPVAESTCHCSISCLGVGGLYQVRQHCTVGGCAMSGSRSQQSMLPRAHHQTCARLHPASRPPFNKPGCLACATGVETVANQQVIQQRFMIC